MKSINPSFLTLAMLCSPLLTFGDTIVMKNGDTYQGRVIREDDSNYILEVKVSETIRDEKTVAKTDVETIGKEKPGSKAFEEIAGFVPTPQLMSEGEYATRIEKVKAFIAEFPKSPELPKANSILEELETEMEVVAAGGIKFGEEMVGADDYAANAYEYDAIVAEKEIREAINRRDFLGALRRFSTYDTSFRHAEGRAGLVPLIVQVTTTFSSTVADSLASLESRVEKRDGGLQTMSPEDRSQTQRALEEQQKTLESRYRSEVDGKETWVTPDAFHKESLEAAAAQAASELKRLDAAEANAPPGALPVAESYRISWEKLGSGTDEEKKAVLAEARTNGMPEIYFEKLRLRAGVAAD